jgi:hypothetical protein
MTMKINIKKAMLTLLAVPVLAAGVAGLVAPHVGAAAASDNGLGLRKGVGSAKGNDQVSCLFGSEKEGCTEGSGIFQIIVNVILFIVGAVAVIMIVIGGVRYTVSNGDSNAVQGAKNTIMYAIVGLVVAIIAYALVNFVVVNIGANQGQ